MNKEQTKRLNDLRDWKAMGNEMSINQQAELLHLEELCKSRFETYTPGPWVVQFHGMPHLVATIRLEDGNSFIAAIEGTDSATKDSNRANALLMAAAPLMHHALKLFLKYDAAHFADENDQINLYSDVFAAVHRALEQVSSGECYDSVLLHRQQGLIEDYAAKVDVMRSALLCAAEYIRSAATAETDQRVFAIEQVIREALMQAGEEHEQN